MVKTPFRSLDQLLHDPTGPLARIGARARQMAVLCDTVRQILPLDLREHLHGVVLKPDQTLVLLTDSPAWASRFRYLESDLLTQLRQGPGLMLSRVSVKVRPPSR